MTRRNPFLLGSGDPIFIIKSIFMEPQMISPPMEPLSYLFAIDRVGSIASILQYLHTTGDYLFGKSLISGPTNLIIYFINKLSNLDLSEIMTSTDYAFLWTYGTLDLPLGRRPPSLVGEFFMQFGYLGIIPLSIIFSMFFRWVRKKQINSNSVMQYWFYTVLSVSILDSVFAEFGVIFKFFFFHLLPIITIYMVIRFMLYEWHYRH